MPLYPGAPALIRANLEALQSGRRVRPAAVGFLTDLQLASINAGRLPDRQIIAEVLFLGQHIYDARMIRDGYTVEDVVDQIESAMDAAAILRNSPGMTTLQNPNPRPDRYGNTVRDTVVLECSARHPRAEIFTVVPKGDARRPKKKATRF